MDKLLKGVVEFTQKDFEAHKALFQDLSGAQKPHTLFIGCSDSRVMPNLMTKTLPGEMFMVRNIGNLVPPYRDTQEYVATTSAIEYAVQVLDVKNIVVCGHSNCGACVALHQPIEEMQKLPHVMKWLELMGDTKKKVIEQIPQNDRAAREWLTEQLNIVEQLKHLLTYPFVKERYLKGTLKLFGWYYIIETGEVYNYNIDKGIFELIRG